MWPQHPVVVAAVYDWVLFAAATVVVCLTAAAVAAAAPGPEAAFVLAHDLAGTSSRISSSFNCVETVNVVAFRGVPFVYIFQTVPVIAAPFSRFWQSL